MTIYHGPLDIDAIVGSIVRIGYTLAAAEFATLDLTGCVCIDVVHTPCDASFREKNWGEIWLMLVFKDRIPRYADWFDDGWRLPLDPSGTRLAWQPAGP